MPVSRLPVSLRFFPIVLLLTILIGGIGCTTDRPTPEETAEVTETESPDVPDALESAWDAHGGLDAWRAQRQLRYTFERTANGKTTRDEQHIDLQTRQVRITGEEFVLGFDGEEAWVQPSLDAFPYGSSPRFYTSTYFYFFAMPFVLADSGVIATDEGTATINDTLYNVTEIRYEEDTGDSPDDVYIIYTDADTHKLELVRFSVTYGDRPPAEPNTALMYTDVATHNGITLPVAGRYHAWDDGVGDPLGPSFQLSDLRFSIEAPNPDLFAMPDDAEIDPLPNQE